MTTTLDPGAKTKIPTAAELAELERLRDETPAPVARYSKLHEGDLAARLARKALARIREQCRPVAPAQRVDDEAGWR